MTDLHQLPAKWRRQSADNYGDRANCMSRCADDLERALQQQGEAVAWMTEWTDEGETVRVTFEYRRGAESRRDEVGGDARVVPLFTHPPKPVVSDEVLDTIALRTMRECWDAAEYTVSRSQARAKIQNIIRAALTAALGVKS